MYTLLQRRACMVDRQGQQLGNYRLLRLLGRGGFAEVYLGQHIYLNSQAALKVLQIVLNDFGLALLAPHTLDHSTQEMQSALVGTMPYLAPEQLQGSARPASDQYSLGVVVYEWLSGRKPFSGSPLEVAMQHISVSPPPL